jgi:hypothetical protein
LLEEVQESGSPEFLRSLSRSMTNYYNKRYDGRGSIFQGEPKYKIIDSDEYVINAQLYIAVKNPMEKFAGGLKVAIERFDEAYDFACDYQFCSLADHIGKRNSPILANDSKPAFPQEGHRELAREFMRGGKFRCRDNSL